MDKSPDQLTDSFNHSNGEGDKTKTKFEEIENVQEESSGTGEIESHRDETKLNDDNDDEEEAPLYPDTSIQLQYVSGERLDIINLHMYM